MNNKNEAIKNFEKKYNCEWIADEESITIKNIGQSYDNTEMCIYLKRKKESETFIDFYIDDIMSFMDETVYTTVSFNFSLIKDLIEILKKYYGVEL